MINIVSREEKKKGWFLGRVRVTKRKKKNKGNTPTLTNTNVFTPTNTNIPTNNFEENWNTDEDHLLELEKKN